MKGAIYLNGCTVIPFGPAALLDFKERIAFMTSSASVGEMKIVPIMEVPRY